MTARKTVASNKVTPKKKSELTFEVNKNLLSEKKTPKQKRKVVETKSTKWRPFRKMAARISNFKQRRPHRSFRLTRRRDYKRSLNLPGYWRFTISVSGIILKNWKTFFVLVIVISLLLIAFGSMTDQETFRELGNLMEQTAPDVINGSWGTLAQSGLLTIATFLGGTTNPTGLQIVSMVLIAILSWLMIVWLLREMVMGRRPRFRDALYGSGSPLISTILVALYLVIQLLPLGIVVTIYTALLSVGILSNGFGMFLASSVTLLVVALTLYWLTATFISLVVVTLPGMYPARAIKIAGDLVVGRRLRIVYRLLWMAFISFIAWLLVMVPVVLLDTLLNSHFKWSWLSWLPVVPSIAVFVGTTVLVWMSSYIYLLYRKIVDDDAAPA